MKKYELLAASALALIYAVPATAQTTTEPPAAQEESTAGEDIIVTATKRETTLLDTPVAVSVTSAETIQQAQIRDLNDLQSVVPSLRVNQLQSSANTNFIIRGFGNGANNAGIEPSVGVFIDGVYRSRSAAQIADLPNLKRVEVLRGPQSTLFGKNASAGIISIVTAEPSSTFGGHLEGSYGNYNAIILKGDVTGPLAETVSFSLSGNYNKRDGYAYDRQLQERVNERNRYGFRGQLLFEPSSDLKFRLIGDYDRIDEDCCVAGNIINGPRTQLAGAVAGRQIVDPGNPFSYAVYNNFPSSNKIDNYGGSLQGDYDFGQLSLTSITAYRKVKADTNQDSDFSGADLIGRNAAQLDIGTFTQELRLASNFDGPFNFLLGGFYFNEKIKQANQISFGADFRGYGNALVQASSGGALNVATLEATFGALEGNPAKYAGAFFRKGDGLNEKYRLKDESGSIFGTLDFEVTDRLTLTAGFNYTKDNKRFSTDVVSNDVFSSINLDAAAYAPFRNQLLFGGALAQGVGTVLGLGRPATAQEIGAFAGVNPAAYGQIAGGATAYANANQNNPQANPLAGLRGFQFLPQFFNLPNAFEKNKTDDGNFSYTLRAAYKASDNLSMYVTYATGFKASSVNLSRDSRPTPTDLIAIRAAGAATVNLASGSRYAGPEKSKVIEAGLKGQFDKAAFNIAVFKQTIDGFQSNVFTGTGFTLSNAERESVFGVEFDGSVTPFSPLTLNLAVTYLDPKYDSFDNGGAILPATAFGGLNVGAANLTGTRPAGIPEFSVSTGATFKQELSDNLTLLLRGDYQYESPVQIAEGAVLLKRTVNQVNLAAALQINKNLELTIWARNVTNNQYLTTIFSSVAQEGSISGYPNQPRTYGVTGRFTF